MGEKEIKIAYEDFLKYELKIISKRIKYQRKVEQDFINNGSFKSSKIPRDQRIRWEYVRYYLNQRLKGKL